MLTQHAGMLSASMLLLAFTKMYCIVSMLMLNVKHDHATLTCCTNMFKMKRYHANFRLPKLALQEMQILLYCHRDSTGFHGKSVGPVFVFTDGKQPNPTELIKTEKVRKWGTKWRQSPVSSCDHQHCPHWVISFFWLPILLFYLWNDNRIWPTLIRRLSECWHANMLNIRY